MPDMRIEVGEVTGIILGSAAGLTTLFYSGRAILRGLGLWKVSSRIVNTNNSSSPSDSIGQSQVGGLDQRPIVRQVQHGGTSHRRRPQ